MAYDLLLNFIDQFGAVSLFLTLCLGVVGLPVPNEVVAITGGALSSGGLINTVPAFIFLYMGVCSGATVGYMLGKFSAQKLIRRFLRQPNIGKFMAKAEALNAKYGSFAVSISCFFPLLRNVMPYLVGVNGMGYRRFALFSYTTAFVWTSIYFIIGTFVGNRLDEINGLIDRYGYYSLGVLAVIAAAYAAIRLAVKRKRQSSKPDASAGL
ncbi:DedA family protein [Paenibacillus xylaniclasticus]|uniref:DedA family protein n=1 Tax=Paenibacillus xylaniclasticus TaxID=588083 RepID=UPI000FDC029C|nr:MULTISPECIES: DedA family protein [Paenibacillus]GFN34101.1 alkaline phosphatase [Paenibacillus curdlanolyticus]